MFMKLFKFWFIKLSNLYLSKLRSFQIHLNYMNIEYIKEFNIEWLRYPTFLYLDEYDILNLMYAQLCL